MTLKLEEIAQIESFIIDWVESVKKLTNPSKVLWCDGSDEEYNLFIKQMLDKGELIELDQKEFPGCYLYRSDPRDVARTEEATYICTRNKEDAGPTNNWMDPIKAKEILFNILKDCMKGRTMYVVPYILGPFNSPYSKAGIQITDSLYVVINLKLMTRMGKKALEYINKKKDFVKGIHSMVNLDPKNKYICHFPEEKLIISVNSNYGGNALLSKKCHALRIASYEAKNEGWLAEHMLIIGIKDPTGRITYLTGAFPSASGKTNLAMLKPPEKYKDWKIYTISDDIAWLHIDKTTGYLHAINPEAGFFGVLPGTNYKTNPNIMETIKRNTIFTNAAITKDKKPWWEGLTEEIPEGLINWKGEPYYKGYAAHPNSRFTVSIYQYPYLSPEYENPNGVPISIIIFGGRRSNVIPLVFEAYSWEHGVLMGAMMRVETTAAAEGKVGVVRNDPFAMKPFCGYNMADYFNHWLEMGKKIKNKPKIFYVNFFRKSKENKYLWPGYGENIRILKWMIERINERVKAVETPIGYIPDKDSLDLEGLNISDKDLDELLNVNPKEYIQEVEAAEEFFKIFGNRFPEILWKELYNLKDRLEKYF